ncbi:hypothetical protein K4F52_009938 [Lecanicillium sp. MT-2017a]|nr:hypothetical protein K4F52_009938 [Lecanicillium sp. MT-2017a]
MAVDTLSLEGQVAIITGSGRENGIGAGIARALSRNGALVVLNFVSSSSAARAEALAKSMRAAGGKVVVVQSSVYTLEGSQFLVNETLKAFGVDRIDILVNNAGVGYAGGVLGAKPEEIDSMLNTNIKGMIYMCQAAVPHMPSGGRIVNVSSSASKRGRPAIPIYGATKAAVDSLTWSLSSELGRSHGITVNAIGPGPVATDICPPELLDEVMASEVAETRAADRYGTIEDMGDAVLLLVSDKARWITGHYSAFLEIF